MNDIVRSSRLTQSRVTRGIGFQVVMMRELCENGDDREMLAELCCGCISTHQLQQSALRSKHGLGGQATALQERRRELVSERQIRVNILIR
jgi:hypothetical protein